MQFLYPQFLFALFAVAIPVVIHLFNFRRFKKIYFSDIRFLKEVTQETHNRNKLKHLLILLSRIFAVTFLVFAFAQPFIPAEKENSVAGTQAISIWIDNSFSMENITTNGTLFDEAKRYAREIAMAHLSTDLFQLLTNDFEGRYQHLVSREDFFKMLDEIKISSSVKSLSEIISRQTDMLNSSEIKNKKAFLISDFQKSISDFGKIKRDTAIKNILIPIATNQQSNVYVDSCWFDSPVHQLNQLEKINVRICNFSNTTMENVPVKLFINGQQKTPSEFSMLPGESKVITLSFILKEPGTQQGRIEITDYPVTYDDIFFFSFSLAKQIDVMCISPKKVSSVQLKNEFTEKYFQSLFGKDSLFALSFADENQLDYSSLGNQHLIILNELNTISSGFSQELNRFIYNGGSLVIFPSTEIDTTSYRNFLSSCSTNFYMQKDTSITKVDKVNFDSEIFKDVFEKSDNQLGMKNENIDLPMVRSYYTFSSRSSTNKEMLMRLQNDNSFFTKYDFGKGKIYLSAVPLKSEWSNLAKHAIFVPLLYKISLNSQPSPPLFYIIGSDNVIEVNPKFTGENNFHIKAENNFDIIPEHRVIDFHSTLFIHNQIKQANNYNLFSGNERMDGISFNYNRKESNLSRYSPDELMLLYKKNGLNNFSMVDAAGKELSKVFSDINQGIKLWKWCIVLVLFFLAIEILLLKNNPKNFVNFL
ncbi:MAG: BatA domain-containing protein [Bacteroidota bacterium]